MKIFLHKIIVVNILFVFVLGTSAQKIYYAPGNENWESNIPEDSTELLYTVYLLGDIKNSFVGNKNLQTLKNYISKLQRFDLLLLKCNS